MFSSDGSHAVRSSPSLACLQSNEVAFGGFQSSAPAKCSEFILMNEIQQDREYIEEKSYGRRASTIPVVEKLFVQVKLSHLSSCSEMLPMSPKKGMCECDSLAGKSPPPMKNASCGVHIGRQRGECMELGIPLPLVAVAVTSHTSPPYGKEFCRNN